MVAGSARWPAGKGINRVAMVGAGRRRYAGWVGRRQQRKRERKAARGYQAEPAFHRRASFPPSEQLSDDAIGALLETESRRNGTPVVVAACGNCREYVEDPNGGRGECLHPGSGVLFPWSDTPPCPFHALIRRR